jgi:hypothetical protein
MPTESGAGGGGCARAGTKSSKNGTATVPWNSLAAMESEKEESSGYVIIIGDGKRRRWLNSPTDRCPCCGVCILVLPTYFEHSEW